MRLYKSPRGTICLAYKPQIYLWLEDNMTVSVSGKGPMIGPEGWHDFENAKLQQDMIDVYEGRKPTINH